MVVDEAQEYHMVQHELQGPSHSSSEESVFIDWEVGTGEIAQSLPYYSTKMLIFSEPSHRKVWQHTIEGH